MASFQDMLQQVFRAAQFPVDSYAPAHWSLDQNMIGELRVLPYIEQWKLALKKNLFHVKLEDHSILVFNNTTDNPSYHYLQSPLALESFRVYLLKIGLKYNQRNKAEHTADYELVFDTAPLKENLTPIRYDVDKQAYKAGSHPMAHLHIGLDNGVRIALRRKLSPLAFSLFVMRHMYPESWIRLLQFSDQFKLRRVLRDGLAFVEDEFWQDLDEIELHLA